MKAQLLIKYSVIMILVSIKLSYAVQNQLPTLYVLHVNGINTTHKEANDNLETLKLNSQMSSTGKYLKWNVVYNPTADEKTTSSTIAAGVNLLDNIIDVGLQKNNELSLKNISKEQYVNAYIIANKLNKNMSKAEYRQLQSQLMPHYQALIKKYGGNNTDAVINEFHKNAPPQFLGVLQLLDEGNNGSQYDYSHTPSSVLLIPHSQGNLYANSLNSQSDDCRYVQCTYDYGEPTFGQYFDGVYKYLRTWSPSLTDLVKSCASSSPELLLKHKYLIDAQFQRQAL